MVINYEEITNEVLLSNLSEFRTVNKKVLYTNIYSHSFSVHNVLFCQYQQSLVYLIKDQQHDLFKVYFITANLDSLSALVLSIKNKSTIMEFITKDIIGPELYSIFENSGFYEYARLNKMSTLKVKSLGLDCNFNIIISDPIYGDKLYEILTNQFDKVVDRLPTRENLNKAIEGGLIYLALCNGVVAGFLWFEIKKVVSEIRYLFVCPEFRGEGISTGLMNEYHKNVISIKKKQLWVLSENNVALKLYSKFGYEFENLSDIILVSRV